MPDPNVFINTDNEDAKRATTLATGIVAVGGGSIFTGD